MDSLFQRRRRLRAPSRTVVVCLLFLLLAAGAQAAHFCAAPGLAGHKQEARSTVGSAAALCLICATAQSATLGGSLAAVLSHIVLGAALASPPQNPMAPEILALRVRPPPAA